MANEQNLIPNSQRSPEEVRENGRKGGIKSGEVRRAKKTFRELMKDYGSLPSEDRPELTNDQAVVYAQYKKAQDEKAMGSTEAAKFIRDTRGESPNNTELTLNATIGTVNISFGDKKVIDGEE